MRRSSQTATALASLALTAIGLSCGAGTGVIHTEPFSASLRAEAAPVAELGVEEPVVTELLEPLPVPPLRDVPYRVILHPDRPIEGSLSVGTASTGYLEQSIELPLDGDVMYVLATHYGRHAHYATEELADIMQRVGERMAERFPGTRVPMGDASAAEGGDIPHHSSHNSGRDIDIPFFVRSSSGRHLTTTGFPRFDESLERGRLVFDVERNWYVLRYFLEEAGGTVQWAFIANWLKRELLDYAISSGQPKEIINMAADVMWQPGDSSPHDDHFHMRLYCSREDRLEGCINWGPEWAWSERFDHVHDARVGELTRALNDDNLDLRVAAIDWLRRIDGRQTGPRLIAALPEQPPDAQLAIIAALTQFRTPGMGPSIIALARATDDDRVREAALAAAATVPMPEAADQLVALAAQGCDAQLPSGPPVCREAARGLLEIQEPALVPDLIRLLGSGDSEARALVARVLERTTGRSDGVNWLWASAPTREAAIAEWWAWYEANASEERVDWLRDSFQQQGYELPAPIESREALTVLIDAMHDDEPLGYIANKLLREVTGEGGPPERWRHSRQRDYWRNVTNRLY